MAGARKILWFLLQSAVAGLAFAFVLVWLRPELLPRPLAQPASPAPLTSYADAVAASAPAIVNVYAMQLVAVRGDDGARRYRPQTVLASAVIIDSRGYLITNYHVIAGADKIIVQLADGRRAEPKRIGADRETDLAVLKIELDNLPALPMGRSDTLRIGDIVLAIGSPFGLSQTVTQGIVSATDRDLLGLTRYENYIQTDAAINTGNSGGALINLSGELVGINTATLANQPRSNAEGIGFAIPVNLVRGVVDELIKQGYVKRGWLGLTTDSLTPAELTLLGVPAELGLLVTAIEVDGPAWRGGLRSEDVITHINDEPVTDWRQAMLLTARLQPGSETSIDAVRNGQKMRLNATVGLRGAPPR